MYPSFAAALGRRVLSPLLPRDLRRRRAAPDRRRLWLHRASPSPPRRAGIARLDPAPNHGACGSNRVAGVTSSVAQSAHGPARRACYRRNVRPLRRTGTRALAALTAVACAVCSLIALAPAAAGGGNANVVAGTVYDGEFASAQNQWSGVQVQFVVTPGEKVTNVAPAEAFCAPTNPTPLSSETIRNDAFSVATSPSIHGLHVTIAGSFRPGGSASGTGKLVTETIQGQPCTESDTWTATALPKGTQLCPDVDTGLLPRPTVTNMTCAKAALAFAAGVRASKQDPSNQTFSIPGFDCTTPHSDPDVRELCTLGNEVLRLP
jgi:hypothetical protein